MITKLNELLEQTNIVGVVASEADMLTALNHPDLADIFEVRLDQPPFSSVANYVCALSEDLAKPIIITPRDAYEGGRRPDWDVTHREELFEEFMQWASLINIEASTAHEFPLVIANAKSKGVGIIVSHHDFAGGLSHVGLYKALETWRDVGGDILKVAVTPSDDYEFSQFLTQIAFIRESVTKLISPMAMGKYGKISRIIAGMNGAPLVYGHLGQATVKGQWHVTELRDMLKKFKE